LKVEGRERVALSIEEAWRRINDPGVIRRSTPGLERLDETAPDHYEAVLEVSLPTLTGRFTGTVDFLERRELELLRIRLKGKGSPGFVEGDATLRLSAVDAETDVHYEADVQVGGQIARLGQRMISGVTKEMAGQFFEALARGDDGSVEAPNPLRAFLVLAWRTLLNLLGLSKRS
jgi:carbon monoxide dehydrogenase subunit G